MGDNSRAHSPGNRFLGTLTRGQGDRLEQGVEAKGLAQDTVSSMPMDTSNTQLNVKCELHRDVRVGFESWP